MKTSSNVNRSRVTAGKARAIKPRGGDRVNPPQITALLKQIREGDDEAATALIEHLKPCVTKIVYCRHSSRRSVEDLIQEVFIKVFAKLDTYSARVPLERWVARIAVNCCTDAYRRKRHRPEFGMCDLGETEAEIVENVTADGGCAHPGRVTSTIDLIRTLLATLNP